MNGEPVLVVGGTGMLGSQVVTELFKRGKASPRAGAAGIGCVPARSRRESRSPGAT